MSTNQHGQRSSTTTEAIGDPGPGLSIVSIGGGTGLSTVLSGLKSYVVSAGLDGGLRHQFISSLTAVVTVTDDGGSSGRLREEFQILPPGDIRNCMAALAEDEGLLTRLFQYRFSSDGDLSGHSFGNIFLTALTGVTGDFLEAIKVTSEVLAIKGRIFPSTMKDVTLIADMEDGSTVLGETKIVATKSRISRLRLAPEFCEPLPETLEALQQADMITIGPGSLYTSIIPNLLVDGIGRAIAESNAAKVYICNIMTQPGETDTFTVEDHITSVLEHSPDLKLDYVIVNSTPIREELKVRYLAEGATEVRVSGATGEADALTRLEAQNGGYQMISADVLSEAGLVRHDGVKLATLLLDILQTWNPTTVASKM